MSVVFVAADPILALALALLIFGDAIYCIQAKQQELTNKLTALQKYKTKGGRGTGEDEVGMRRGEQRNQATTGYELKKKRRSRTRKGINSRDPCLRVETHRWRPASRDGGSLPASRGGGSSLAADE